VFGGKTIFTETFDVLILHYAAQGVQRGLGFDKSRKMNQPVTCGVGN
jgi:hypothetical protein